MSALRRWVALSALLLCSMTHAASATTVYGVGAAGALYRVNDLVSGNSTVLTPMTATMCDVAWRESDKTLWGIGCSGSLYRINPATSVLTFVSNPGVVDPSSATFCGDTLYLWAGTQIYAVNVTGGGATPLGATSGYQGSGDLACDSSGGLFGSARSPTGSGNDVLVVINRQTGAATLIGSLGTTKVFGLDFDSDGRLYGSSDATRSFFRIDPATGATLATYAPLSIGAAVYGTAFYTEDGGCAMSQVVALYPDADGDGFAPIGASVQGYGCAPGAGQSTLPTDCNDAAAAVYPGAPERCNTIDDDCDTQIDDGLNATWYQDADGDGYGNPAVSLVACAQPTGYVAQSGDCNDSSASVGPGAVEVCNGVDEDCDGQIDEGVLGTWFQDLDGDGYGNTSVTTRACTRPSGYSALGGDCNDSSAAVSPGATEQCNDIDDDCDGKVDEGLKGTFYRDADADTYGSPSTTTQACGAPSGYVATSGDCNDQDPAIHPGAAEIPYDGVDQDCSGVDQADVDGDGFPATQVIGGTDCDDQNGQVHPGQPELPNGIDDDCDGQIDEGTSGQDLDGDGYTLAEEDCDDEDPDVHPDAEEVCDEADQDCDEVIDEGTECSDDDGDGYSEDGSIGGAADCDDDNTNTWPDAPEIADGEDNDCDGLIDDELDTYDDDGDGFSETSGDCDDSDPAIHPDMEEVCDGVDQQCDGVIDDGTECFDDDGDSYTEEGGDCDDEDAAVHPDQADPEDGIDQDCDGLIDEDAPTASPTVEPTEGETESSATPGPTEGETEPPTEGETESSATPGPTEGETESSATPGPTEGETESSATPGPTDGGTQPPTPPVDATPPIEDGSESPTPVAAGGCDCDSSGGGAFPPAALLLALASLRRRAR